MKSILPIISARMESNRLPGKVLFDLCGKSVISHHVERMLQSKAEKKPYLATSSSKKNIKLIEEAKNLDILYYCGAEEDIAERFINILEKENCSAAIRCACDQPLFSFEIVDKLLEQYNGEDYVYPINKLCKGIGLEIISLKALKETRKYYRGPAITKYILEYPYKFTLKGISVDDYFSRPEFRLTLDTLEDYKLFEIIFNKFYEVGKPIVLKKVFQYLDDNPEIANMNRFANESNINKYVPELINKPVFKIFMKPNGKYIVENKMSEIINPSFFLKTINNFSWDE